MKPTFSARARFKSWTEILATSSLSSQISPELGRSRHPIRLTRVDLPEPEGPMTASHSPGATSRETSSRARMTPPLVSAWAGYRRLTWLSLIMSLSPQDGSRLDPPQQRYWQDRGDQGDGYSARQNDRQDAQAGSDRGVKVGLANPDRHSDADGKTKRSADRTQYGGLGGEEPLQHPARSAQGLHQGKVAAAVRNPPRQSGKNAHRGGKNDEYGCYQKCGSHLAQHIGFALRDLTHRVHVGS